MQPSAMLKRSARLIALLPIMLLATGCAKTVHVAPEKPILPPCILIPAHLLAPMEANWLPSPVPTLKQSPEMRCEVVKPKPS